MTSHNPVRTVLAVLALMLSVQAQGSTAPISTWQPTDNDVNFAGTQLYCASESTCTSLGAAPTGVRFALFAAGDASLNGAQYLPINAAGDRVTFSQQGTDWLLGNHEGDSLTLTGNRFSLGASTDGGSTWTANTDQLNHGSNWYYSQFGGLTSSYALAGTSLNTRVALTTVDASPVPVPAAVWLFGSGLIALGAVARRRLGRSR
ncbi:MAG TPA: VPLPA-CTERM sorting domain-containing protein [Gammaproteobacteria bacterium]|nr:VPLPA-CTERM sorting domain-containing protein [Gammaproteobacteria bacterium]